MKYEFHPAALQEYEDRKSQISKLKSIEVIYVSLQNHVTFSHRQGDRGRLFFELRQITSCLECSELNRRCAR